MYLYIWNNSSIRSSGRSNVVEEVVYTISVLRVQNDLLCNGTAQLLASLLLYLLAKTWPRLGKIKVTYGKNASSELPI